MDAISPELVRGIRDGQAPSMPERATFEQRVRCPVVETLAQLAAQISGVCALIWRLILGRELAVLQASRVDGLLLDSFALFDDGFGPAEVGVGRCPIPEALVVAPDEPGTIEPIAHEGADRIFGCCHVVEYTTSLEFADIRVPSIDCELLWPIFA